SSIRFVATRVPLPEADATLPPPHDSYGGVRVVHATTSEREKTVRTYHPHRLRTVRPRKVASTAAIVCLIASTAAALTAASASAGVTPAPERAGTSPPSGNTHTVTLLTGDRVEYTEVSGGRPRVIVDPADRPDGSTVTFTTTTVAGPGGLPA